MAFITQIKDIHPKQIIKALKDKINAEYEALGVIKGFMITVLSFLGLDKIFFSKETLKIVQNKTWLEQHKKDKIKDKIHLSLVSDNLQ